MVEKTKQPTMAELIKQLQLVIDEAAKTLAKERLVRYNSLLKYPEIANDRHFMLAYEKLSSARLAKASGEEVRDIIDELDEIVDKHILRSKIHF